MNICFLSQEFPPEAKIGGIGTYTLNMASYLSKLGHSVHWITSTSNSQETFVYNNVLIHALKTLNVRPKEIAQLYYSFSVAQKLFQLNHRFDIVHASEFAGEAFIFSLKKKYPLVTRLATPLFLLERLNGKMFLGPRPVLNWMEKKQTLLSDGVFSSTFALAREVSEEWGLEPSRVAVIPNSIDTNRVSVLGNNEPCPSILKGKDFVLYFGRLEERKGVHILAQSLPTIFEQSPHLSMVFVGSDLGYRGSSFREYIKRKAGKWHNQIIFFDKLLHEDLLPIVKAAKIVVLPSLWEAFGFVSVEAMALGRPVVATSGSGFDEIIENNVSGYLVEPGDSELLAQKIISVLQDEKSLSLVSDNAKVRAKHFDVLNIAPKLITYYETVRQKWLKSKRNYQ